MGIEIVDLIKLAHEDPRRHLLINTSRFHAAMHIYREPGHKDDMHCHNADQTFYLIEGECTMRFPDGGKSVMKPGMAALITGGSFYQLENTGTGHMVLLLSRSGPNEAIQHINYETRQHMSHETRSQTIYKKTRV